MHETNFAVDLNFVVFWIFPRALGCGTTESSKIKKVAQGDIQKDILLRVLCYYIILYYIAWYYYICVCLSTLIDCEIPEDWDHFIVTRNISVQKLSLSQLLNEWLTKSMYKNLQVTLNQLLNPPRLQLFIYIMCFLICYVCHSFKIQSFNLY